MSSNGIKSAVPEIDRQAAEWFGRRELGLSPGQEQEFQFWLSADHRHAEHYRQFDETWAMLDDLKELQHLRPASPGKLNQGLVFPRRSWLPATLAVAAAIAVAFIFWTRPDSDFVSYAIATERGGMQKLELPDGSVVRLNSDTALAVNLTAGERRISLQRGEAYFTVAKDPSRPFIVSVAGVSVRAVGTAFNVALGSSSLEVLVTEGKVRMEELIKGQSVLPGWQGGKEQPVLEPGQKAVLALLPETALAPVATVVGVTPPEAEKTLAWQVKLLEFDMQPLSEVVAEFNRYNQHQLVIADPELAGRIFGGTLRADNYEALVELLAARFGVTAERSGGKTILRARK